jgi:DNA-binding MarR family transcriptional regulator/GNAT superfamily N-acetyltransferase
MSEKDFLTELGFISFVTRLKRVSDSMIHDGRRVYKELGMDIEPNWYVIFKLLEKYEELTVTEIAEKIGFAHPSVITMVNKMIRAGYLESSQCSVDSRRRLLVLSEKAKKAIPNFEQVWDAGIAGVKNMLADKDYLEFLEILEKRIAEKGFKQRTLASLKEKQVVEITGFEERYAQDFGRLNYEWVEEFFEVEEHDREQLDHPGKNIIEPGGQILLAKIGDEIVGTAALIKMEGNHFELAKMAVSKNHRGHSIGKKLMIACLEYAKNADKESIILESNRKQVPAINMYRKFGFVEIEPDPNTEYTRSDIRMQLIL